MTYAQMQELQSCTRGYFYTSEQDAMREFAEDRGTEIPYKNEVCGSCRGEGTRAMGGMAITGELLEDSEFMENYFDGRYDKTCEDCGGTRVVRVPDFERMKPAVRRDLEQWLEENRQSNAESLAEKRMGA